jgi:signal transduction histidine kinase
MMILKRAQESEVAKSAAVKGGLLKGGEPKPLITQKGAGRVTNHRGYYAIAIIAISLFTTYLHYSTFPGDVAHHEIYRELYYVPVFMGALAFGLKGALLSYLLVLALYAPYVFISWTGNMASEASKALHLLLQGILALFAGRLIDRDRRHREQLQKERYLSGIGQAATAIVHDLRNPLVTVLGFARRIQEGKGNLDGNIQEIIDSAHSMQRIVNDVLDFARPIRLELREEDLRHVVSRACHVCRINADQEGVTISCDLPPGPVRAVIDRFQMERAITNFLSNAVEASRKGQTVIVRMEPSGSRVILTVRDHGSGMDSETLENVFIPFYTKKSNGTGLGMAIAKRIVDSHRGTIEIKSKRGEGTEVKVALPQKL